jgi:hypothetical protein
MFPTFLPFFFFSFQELIEATLGPGLAALYFPLHLLIYLVASIRKAVASYSYNLSLTKTRLLKVDILVPVVNELEVDVQAMRDCVTSLRNAELIDHIPEDRLVD